MFLSLKYFSQTKGIKQTKDCLEMWKLTLIKINILLLNLVMPILTGDLFKTNLFRWHAKMYNIKKD